VLTKRLDIDLRPIGRGVGPQKLDASAIAAKALCPGSLGARDEKSGTICA
jgi:hypothetical protein